MWKEKSKVLRRQRLQETVIVLREQIGMTQI